MRRGSQASTEGVRIVCCSCFYWFSRKRGVFETLCDAYTVTAYE